MAIELTLSIIKPDAVAKSVIGQIYTRFENAGLTVIAARIRNYLVNKPSIFMISTKSVLFSKIW